MRRNGAQRGQETSGALTPMRAMKGTAHLLDTQGLDVERSGHRLMTTFCNKALIARHI